MEAVTIVAQWPAAANFDDVEGVAALTTDNGKVGRARGSGRGKALKCEPTYRVPSQSEIG